METIEQATEAYGDGLLNSVEYLYKIAHAIALVADDENQSLELANWLLTKLNK